MAISGELYGPAICHFTRGSMGGWGGGEQMGRGSRGDVSGEMGSEDRRKIGSGEIESVI